MDNQNNAYKLEDSSESPRKPAVIGRGKTRKERRKARKERAKDRKESIRTDDERRALRANLSPNKAEDEGLDEQDLALVADWDEWLSSQDDSEKALQEMAKKYPPLTKGQEIMAFRVIKAVGSTAEEKRAAKNDIIYHTIHLVMRLARKPKPGCSFNDRCQLGFIGTMKAIKNFEPKRGNSFSLYARKYISGEISYWWRKWGRCIQLPHWISKARSKLTRFQREYEQIHGHGPTEEQMAQRLKFNLDQLQTVLDVMETGEIESLTREPDDPVPEPATHSLYKDDLIDQSENGAVCAEQAESMKRAFDTLNDQEKAVFRMSFVQELTVNQIANKLGIPRDRARAILKRALRKFRCRFQLRTEVSAECTRQSSIRLDRVAASKQISNRAPVGAKKEGKSAEVDFANLIHKVVYKPELEPLVAVVLGCLKKASGRWNRDELRNEAASSIAMAKLEPISEDPEDNEPIELADFAIFHLLHDRHMAESASDKRIKITAQGREWLSRFRKRAESTVPEGTDVVTINVAPSSVD